MTAEYVCDLEAPNAGASRRGTVSLTYGALVRAFGRPGPPSADGKVSAEWRFMHALSGETYTIYDYKQTSLYGGAQLPSPDEFRRRYWLEAFNWQVGAILGSDVEAFIAWITRVCHPGLDVASS